MPCRGRARLRAADEHADEHAFALQHCAPDGAVGANCTTLRADGTRNVTRFTALPPHVQTRARANRKRSRRCGGCDAHHETKFVNRDGSETPLGAVNLYREQSAPARCSQDAQLLHT